MMSSSWVFIPLILTSLATAAGPRMRGPAIASAADCAAQLTVAYPSTLTSVQEQVLDFFSDWITANGRPPKVSELQKGIIQPPVYYRRIIAEKDYAFGGRKAHEALFPSQQFFWLALRSRMATQGRDFRLYELNPKFEYGQAYVEALREDALGAVHRWIIDPRNSRLPFANDFGLKEGEIPLDYEKLTGQVEYSPDGTQARRAIFPSVGEFWIALKEFCARRGLEIFISQVFALPSTPRLRPILQEEALELSYRWSVLNGLQVPTHEAFGTGEGQINLYYSRVVGTSHYGPEGAQRHLAIFDSSVQYWQALARYAAARGTSILLSGSGHLTTMTPALRHTLQQEALRAIGQWQKANPGIGSPRRGHFDASGGEAGKIPLSYARVYGLGHYGFAGKLAHQAIFSSPTEAVREIELNGFLVGLSSASPEDLAANSATNRTMARAYRRALATGDEGHAARIQRLMLEANLGLVRRAAGEVLRRSINANGRVSLDELVNHGVAFLGKELKNYDPEKGAFSTYFYRPLKGEMGDFFRRGRSILHVPPRAEANLVPRTVSADAPRRGGGEDDRTVGDGIADENGASADESVIRGERIAGVRGAMAEMRRELADSEAYDDIDRDIFERRTALRGSDEMESHRAIGASHGISGEAIRQREARLSARFIEILERRGLGPDSGR